MKKVVLHEDEDSRKSTNISDNKYAMETSDEYVDCFKINKVHLSRKAEDGTDKLK